MVNTSSEAYEEYQRLKLSEERLQKNNRGQSLFSQSQLPSFFIKVNKVVEGNLLETHSEIIVDSNLPFCCSWSYHDITTDKFLRDLKGFIEIPIFQNFIQRCRKRDNGISYWNVPDFRNSKISMDDVDFTFGEEAKAEGIEADFRKKVELLFSMQKEVTEVQEKDFRRYILLLHKVEDLRRQIKKSSSNYGYYGGREDTSTIKIALDDDDYDKKLSKIEVELKSLKKKYSFLELPTLYYQKKDDEEEDDYDDDDEDYDEED